MRRAVVAALLLNICCGGQGAIAQDLSPPRDSYQSPVLTVKQQDLFEGSAFGKASTDRLEAASNALQAENRQIESMLEAEERALTERRATLPPEEFRIEAEAFDKKVEAIRNAQDAKARDLSRQRERDQQNFFQVAVPVMADMMREMGAVALLDQSAVMLSLESIDITQEAIALVDARMAQTAGQAETPESTPDALAPAVQTPDAPQTDAPETPKP